MHQSIPAVPIPPRANPPGIRQIPGGGDKEVRQMPQGGTKIEGKCPTPRII